MRIELSHVSKRFGSVVALSDVTATIASGAAVGLVGPNGSGKSTLLRALMGLVRCEGGVRLDGRDPFEHRMAIAPRLAYVPQLAPQWGAPVSDVVSAVVELRGMESSPIENLCDRLELDLASIRDRRFRDLSGGMKQKLLVALALAVRPALLILDEPTASLDARARARFFDLLEDQAPNATKLICSHRGDDLVDIVERVLALHDGRLVFDGPAHEFGDIEREATGPRPALRIRPTASEVAR